MSECEEIARGLRKRDSALLDRLIEQYQHRLFRFLLFVTRDRQLAEDLFQETWIRVLERGSQYSSRYKFETWLLSIARNLAIDQLRRKTPASFSELESEDDQPVDFRDERIPDTVECIARQQQDAHVASLLDHLPPLYREVLTLRFHEDMQLDEIARVLGCPVSTVKSRLHRGLDMLEKRLEAARNVRGGAR